MNFSSKLLENAVGEFTKLPGIGQKTALRLVLHLLDQDRDDVDRFSRSMTKLRNEIQHCRVCHNISDYTVCEVCASHNGIEMNEFAYAGFIVVEVGLNNPQPCHIIRLIRDRGEPLN